MKNPKLTVYMAAPEGFVQGLIVLPLLLMLYQIRPWDILRSAWPALVMASVTKSSTATLPLTMDCAKRRAQFFQRAYGDDFTVVCDG